MWYYSSNCGSNTRKSLHHNSRACRWQNWAQLRCYLPTIYSSLLCASDIHYVLDIPRYFRNYLLE